LNRFFYEDVGIMEFGERLQINKFELAGTVPGADTIIPLPPMDAPGDIKNKKSPARIHPYRKNNH